MYVNTLPQCSPGSVGLAQACPNYSTMDDVICPLQLTDYFE